MAATFNEVMDILDKWQFSALGEPPTCSICKYLNIININELYALCKKTWTLFIPFELDTREHYCTCFRRKEK